MDTEDFSFWRSQLINISTRRPEMYPISQIILQRVHTLSRQLGWKTEDCQKAEEIALMHEIGKYLYLGVNKQIPENIFDCLHAGTAARITGENIPPYPSSIDALIAYCELTTSADGTIVSLQQRQATIERNYNQGHPVRLAYEKKVQSAQSIISQLK